MTVGARKELLTVDEVRGWLRDMESERKLREGQTRKYIIHGVLTEFTQQVRTQGRTLQDAADYTWRKWSRIASQPDEKQIVVDTLSAVGWVRLCRGAKQ
jgi:hypothetical protein